MKPSIPDTGTVIRLDGENAVVRMQGEGSCRKCGAAALGLCTGGHGRELIVKNSMAAAVGDSVKIGLVQSLHIRGYLLAYVIPSAALVCGTVAGYVLRAYAGWPGMESIAGFGSLIVASFFSFRRLKQLDSSSSIEIVDVLFDPWEPPVPRPREESRPDHFALYV